MPVRDDYWIDVRMHENFSKVLAVNLCGRRPCFLEHSEEVVLNGTPEKQVTGAGSGKPVCLICRRHCGLKHEDFNRFFTRVVRLFGVEDEVVTNKELRAKLWFAVTESGFDDRFEKCVNFKDSGSSSQTML